MKHNTKNKQTDMKKIFRSSIAVSLMAWSAMAADSSPDRYLDKEKRTLSPGNTTYVIDPVKGDDANPAGKPWKTFGKLNALKLAPGDKVVIAPGQQEESQWAEGQRTTPL
jgi:LDH2 family malate/lactate/ureidoglycolate dehydrogenase